MLYLFLPQGQCIIWLELSNAQVVVIEWKLLQQNPEFIRALPFFCKMRAWQWGKGRWENRRCLMDHIAHWKEYIWRLKIWKLIALKLSVPTYHLKSLSGVRRWLKSVKRWTLDFVSVHDLRIVRRSPMLAWEALSPSASPPHHPLVCIHSLSNE